MSGNVVPLKGQTPPGEPVPGVVRQVEEMLEAARSGELRALAVVLVYRDGTLITGWEQPDSGMENARTIENHGLGSGILTLGYKYGRASAGE